MLDKRDPKGLTRLGELETVIERGLTTFVEVGNAIREIRDSGLYKDSHDTFEKYCRERWGWNKNYAYKQVRAADTAAIVGTNVPIPNEAVAREFAPLKGDPETMNRVWGGVVEEHGETPAAKHVRNAVEQAKTAERIRAQLPPATRTVVEGIDPDDCNLPNEPKQLTRLLDASLKHGDEQTAQTAERVANGEFKSTFDAYPEVKEESKTTGEPVVHEFDPGRKELTAEQNAFYDISKYLVRLRRMDPEKVAAEWLEVREEIPVRLPMKDVDTVLEWFGRYREAMEKLERRHRRETGNLSVVGGDDG